MSDSSDVTGAASEALPRSPEMMNPDDTGLLVVDAQERLLAVVPGAARVVWNLRRLLQTAAVLGVPRAATEQYPEKLGSLPAELSGLVHIVRPKRAFSCGACGEIFQTWREAGIHRVLLAGIETHVCIAQTALDLLADGYSVYLACDATATRHAADYEFALRRLESSGVTLTTTEAAMFEWCRSSDIPEFKQISSLAKETPPE